MDGASICQNCFVLIGLWSKKHIPTLRRYKMNKKVVLPVVLMLSTLLLVAVFTILNTATATAVSTPTNQPTIINNPQASTICSELVINGDMEEDLAWIMPPTPATAVYSTDQAHSGERSIRIGIISGANREAYSTAYQPVSIPTETITATLTFWLYPVSTGTLSVPDQAEILPGVITGQLPAAPAVGDVQYVLILDQNGNVLEILLWIRENNQTWEQHTFDLSHYVGQTIWILFGVYNDGIGGITGMYLDDVSLDACRPLPDMPNKRYLPIILHDYTPPEPPPPPPPEDLLMIDGEVVTRLIGHPDSTAIYALTAAGFYRSSDGAETWGLITDTLPVTGTIHLAPSQPATLYAGVGWPCFKGGPPTPFWRSDDSGQSWGQLPAGTNLEPMTVHASDGQRVYAQTCDGPYLSDDGGESWVHQPDDEFDLFEIYNVFHLAAAEADDWQTVYVGGISEGGSGAIISSQDGGENWAQLTPLGADIWAIGSLAMDPISTTHLYFGESLGFWGTLDGGTTWYTSTTGLEDVIYDPEGPGDQTYGLLSLVILPTNRQFLLLGTAEGLYISGDRGLTWGKVTGTVWEDERITDLLLRAAEPNKLFLTTEDGVYVYQLGP
jgi:photosystem II stability/assembly factor-like uncharacterized protein